MYYMIYPFRLSIPSAVPDQINTDYPMLIYLQAIVASPSAPRRPRLTTARMSPLPLSYNPLAALPRPESTLSPNLPILSTLGAPQTNTFPVPLSANPAFLTHEISSSRLHQLRVSVDVVGGESPDPVRRDGEENDGVPPVGIPEDRADGEDVCGTSLGTWACPVVCPDKSWFWTRSRSSSSMDRRFAREAKGGRRSSTSDWVSAWSFCRMTSDEE